MAGARGRRKSLGTYSSSQKDLELLVFWWMRPRVEEFTYQPYSPLDMS